MNDEIIIFKAKKSIPRIALIIEGALLYLWGKHIITTDGKINPELDLMTQKYLFAGITILLLLSILITLVILLKKSDLVLTKISLINQNAQNDVTHIDWHDITEIKTAEYGKILLFFIDTEYDLKYFADISSRRKLSLLGKNTEKYGTPFAINLNRFVADNHEITTNIKEYFRKYKSVEKSFFTFDID